MHGINVQILINFNGYILRSMFQPETSGLLQKFYE